MKITPPPLGRAPGPDTLAPDAVSRPVAHRTVEEIWYVLALALIPARTRLLSIESGTHALASSRRRSAAPPVDVAEATAAAFLELVG